VRAIPSVADVQRLRLPPVWFMIQRFLGEGISPTPRRELVADHMQACSSTTVAVIFSRVGVLTGFRCLSVLILSDER